MTNPNNQDITVSRDQAIVAMAYLGESETYTELAGQLAAKAMTRRVMMAQLPDLMPGTDPDAALQADAPELYKLAVPIKHQAALVGAFTLSIEGTRPITPEAIEDFTPEQVVDIASAARTALLGS